MKVLVTGAAGFIGSHLVDQLLLEGHQVIGLDNLINGKRENLSEAFKAPNFTFIEGDIRDNETCLKATRVEVVYHLACLGVRHSLHSPYENHEVNAEGSLKVLAACKENKVKKFFYISTSEVYGRTTDFPITEANETKPLTVYGASKLAGEHYTNAYQECFGLDTTVFRIFNNYGPRAHYEGDSGEVIPRSIVKVLYGENPVIFGDGNVTRDFFYVKDTAKVLVRLMNNKEISGRTINIGTGVEITMKKLVTDILSYIPEKNVQIDYLEDRPADVPRLWVDNTEISKIIDLKVMMPFKEGIKHTVEFYKDLSKSKKLVEELHTINWKK